MKDAFERKEYLSAGDIAHKLLPLFRMIGDQQVVRLMDSLEKGDRISTREEQLLLGSIKKKIEEALILKQEIGK